MHAIVVPGSAQVKRQAEDEGLDEIFEAAGFEWRQAGCSMCLGMNPDMLAPGERCASTSNRNFEGRQGAGGRTHLVSPGDGRGRRARGHFADVRELRRMRTLRSVTGKVAVLDRADVDTDQIIPKQFLKRIERSGYGRVPVLRLDEGSGFVLQRPREPRRADPDRRPQLRLRLVARARGLGARGLRLPRRARAVVRRHLPPNAIKTRARADPASRRPTSRASRGARRRNELTVDLEHLRITHPDGLALEFAFDPYAQETLVHGLDDVARTLHRADEITAFEATHAARFDVRALVL